MFVKNHLLEREYLTLLDKDDTLKTALQKMEDGGFLSLPVVDGDRFCGYIMKESIFSDYFHGHEVDRDRFLQQNVSAFMKTDVRALDPDDGIDKASYAIEKMNIPFLPVVNSDGLFLGIITHAAVFKAFSDLFHIGKGRQMVIYIFNIPGQLSRLLNVFRREDVNVESMVVMDAKVMGILKVIARVETDNFPDIIEKIEKEGFKTGELQ